MIREGQCISLGPQLLLLGILMVAASAGGELHDHKNPKQQLTQAERAEISELWSVGTEAAVAAASAAPPMLRGARSEQKQPVATAPRQSSATGSSVDSTVLLVVCFNRSDYLERTLRSVLSHHPLTAEPTEAFDSTEVESTKWSVVVSQDGGASAAADAAVARVVESFAASIQRQSGGTMSVTHIRHPPLPAPQRAAQEAEDPDVGYARVAAHYGWALARAFQTEPMMTDPPRDPDPVSGPAERAAAAAATAASSSAAGPPPDRVIVIEDDMDIAPGS